MNILKNHKFLNSISLKMDEKDIFGIYIAGLNYDKPTTTGKFVITFYDFFAFKNVVTNKFYLQLNGNIKNHRTYNKIHYVIDMETHEVVTIRLFKTLPHPLSNFDYFWDKPNRTVFKFLIVPNGNESIFEAIDKSQLLNSSSMSKKYSLEFKGLLKGNVSFIQMNYNIIHGACVNAFKDNENIFPNLTQIEKEFLSKHGNYIPSNVSNKIFDDEDNTQYNIVDKKDNNTMNANEELKRLENIKNHIHDYKSSTEDLLNIFKDLKINLSDLFSDTLKTMPLSKTIESDDDEQEDEKVEMNNEIEEDDNTPFVGDDDHAKLGILYPNMDSTCTSNNDVSTSENTTKTKCIPSDIPDTPLNHRILGTEPKKEMVNHPKHYQGDGIEVIDIIEAFDLDFCLGNAIKYILRCGKKDSSIQELKKAIWYLNRKIDKLTEEATNICFK